MLKRTAAILLLAITALGFAGTALAQDDAASSTQPAASAAQQQVPALIKELRQKSAKLQQIHAQTLQGDNDLQAQQDEFVTAVRKAIKANGYDLAAGQERVKAMTDKLQNNDLSADDQQAIKQKIAGEQQALGKARTAALQQPDITKAGQSLEEATITAMKKQDPDVQTLIDDLDSLRQQLRAAMQKAQAAPAG